MTISAAERFISSSSLIPVGMPRRLSGTDMDWSVGRVRMTWPKKPASASSTELSTTSKTMWCKPVPSEVSPIYMPGRLRTASRPFRTLMASEPYSLALGLRFAAKSDPHRHHDVFEALFARVADERAGRGIAERTLQLIARHIVQHVEQVVDIEADVQRIAPIAHLELLLRLFLVGIGRYDLQAAVGQDPAHAAELFIRQDRRALQRLAQRLALPLHPVLGLRPDDSWLIGKLAVDQLGDELDRPEAEPRLRRGQFHAHFAPAL